MYNQKKRLVKFMMTMEEQKSVASKVSCSPKPLDTTTQGGSCLEDLELLIRGTRLLTQEGKKIDGNDLFNLLSKALEMHRVSPVQLAELQTRYKEIIQEEDLVRAWINFNSFYDDLEKLLGSKDIPDILKRQKERSFFLMVFDNVANTGRYLKEDDIKAVLNTITGVTKEEVEMHYREYQRILKEEDMGVARGNAVKFIGDLRVLGADEKVCSIFLKQFGRCFLLKDDIKTVLNMIPGISAKKSDELYRRYQLILQEKNMEFAREYAKDFLDNLSRPEVDEKIRNIISKQFDLRFKYAEYYNEQVADEDSVRKLLSKIPEVSSECIDKLYEEYKNIVSKKNRDGAVGFIYKLLGIGANEIICDIIQIEFCKNGIILPAEVRPSISGNLFVPEDADYKKCYEDGGEFRRGECGNPATRPLDEELVEYFKKLIIEPFEECKGLMDYICEKITDGKRSLEANRNLFKKLDKLDSLISGRIDATFKECLEKVTRFSKELVSVGNRENDRKLKTIATDSLNNIIRRLLFDELKSKLPSEEDFRSIKEFIAMSYELKGRKPASQGQKRSTFTRTPFYNTYDVISFTYQLYGLVNALILSKEPLFPHDPCLDDIKQGYYIGDCYLLASIASLLNSYGPDFIRNMMIDNGDGTVTVRLYAQSQREYDEGKSHVKYVKVYKYGLMSNPKSALWVQIIEKAYISLGANLYEERKKGKLIGIRGKYKDYKKFYARAVEDLRSGWEKHALMVLAGIKCNWFFGNNFDEERFKRAISQKLTITCTFKSDFSCNGDNFRCRHAYSIIGAEEGRGGTIVKLVDPHDAGKDMFCSLEELRKHINCCTIADVDSQTEGMDS